MTDAFAGIVQTYRRVKDVAIEHGWTVAAETTASTDSRYLEIVRGAESLKLRVSHHVSLSECDISIDPSNPAMTETLTALAGVPKFQNKSEAKAWIKAMWGRSYWMQAQEARRSGMNERAEQLEVLAREAERENPYLVSGGRRRPFHVNAEWLSRIEKQIEI